MALVHAGDRPPGGRRAAARRRRALPLPAVLLSGGETTVTVRGKGAAGATRNSCWRWPWRSMAMPASTRSPATPTASTAPRTMPARSSAPTRSARADAQGLDLRAHACRQRRLRRLRRARRSGGHRPDAAPMSTISAPSCVAASSTERGQDMRRQRSAKIVATLGPASSTPRDRSSALFRRRRRCLPAQFQPRHARATIARASTRSARSRRRPGGRSASWPICRGRSCASAPSPTARSSSSPASAFASTSTRRRAMRKRAPLPHPEIFAAIEPGTELLLDDGNVRLKVESCGARFRRDRW